VNRPVWTRDLSQMVQKPFSHFFWFPLSRQFFNGFRHLRMVRPQNADKGDTLRYGKLATNKLPDNLHGTRYHKLRIS
jgi:hypothetical protein